MITKSTHEDIPSLLSLFAEARATIATLGIDQWQNGYPDRAAIVADIEGGVGLVIDSAEGIAAYCAAIFGDEPTYTRIDDGEWLTSGEEYVVVHRLAVADRCKRQGIATDFLRRVESIARERSCRSFRIDTHHDNLYMQTICQRLGFVRCGVIYVSDGTPRIAYEKVL